MISIFWFGRDRRLQDNEALTFAAESSPSLLPVFVYPADSIGLSSLREASIAASVKALSESLPLGLQVITGDPAVVLKELAKKSGASRIIATRAFDPEGAKHQHELAAALAASEVELLLIGSNYQVMPGQVLKDDGTPLRVYTPFYKRWLNFGATEPFLLDVEGVQWLAPDASIQHDFLGSVSASLQAGEKHALETWRRFRQERIFDYSDNRNRPDLNGTSKLSHALAHGEIHPRTLLAQLGNSPGEEVFRKEIAWREFYADVLFHNPHTVDEYYDKRFEQLRYDDPEKFPEKLTAWKTGQTGYPIVDAAMRQLVETGWMHNRARMIVASFLVKDLHFEWQVGARFFEQHLTDYDPASNSHGWQWTAGCGTDASPFYRVFNPILQGSKFDPAGEYVRRWIPELRHLEGARVHEPWNDIAGFQNGYPPPIIDHSQERDEALGRLEEIKR
ncbi:MAG: deoxyribodipyrimidine photo-lyase [Aquiluna sp.]|nr:deoxyribodipyrimidine photo-lyase [Aquiluna sp.]